MKMKYSIKVKLTLMRKLLYNRIESNRGFTLAETLLAVLILLMVSAIVATGIPSAKAAYEKVVLASNAEVLLSTTMSSLRNELATAKNIETGDEVGGKDTSLTYYNTTRGSKSKIYKYSGSVAAGAIMIQQYVKVDGIGKDSDPVRLVSKTASTGDLYVTYEYVTYSDGIITFRNLSVNRESGSTGLAERSALSIRVISDKHS